MATLKINGDTSGYVELVSPAVAGSTSIALDKILVSDSSGNVGFGTTSPDTPLHVRKAGNPNGGNRNTVETVLTLDATGYYPYGGYGVGIDFKGEDYGNTAIREYAKIEAVMVGHSNQTAAGDSAFTSALTFATNSGGASSTLATEKMRIDSSGNVGIGTSSPSSTLAVETSSTASLSSYAGHIVVGPSTRTSADGDLSGGILFDQANGVQVSGKKGSSITGFQDGSDVNSMGITFNVHGTDGSANRFEAMRIDSSGKLLVGKASAGYNVNGFETHPNGETYVSRSGTPMAINRNSSHGTLLNFYKDGAGVGNIGTAGGDLYIGNDDTGLYFNDANNVIHSYNVTTQSGGSTNGTVDLGQDNIRFKDLYLSGGINFGGSVNSGGTVSSSNKLDDYEEGLHTYTLKGANSGNATIPIRSGYTKLAYTKIGRMVTVTGKIETGGSHSATGALRLSLPFTAANLSDQAGVAGGSCFIFRTSQSIYDNPAILPNTTAPYAIFYYNTTSGDVAAINANNLDAAFEILVSFSYFTNA